MKVSADVRAMIERRKKSHTLEAPFYTSEEIFALDMEAIFRKHWIQVAVEPDVPEAGRLHHGGNRQRFDPDRARRRHAGAGVP